MALRQEWHVRLGENAQVTQYAGRNEQVHLSVLYAERKGQVHLVLFAKRNEQVHLLVLYAERKGQVHLVLFAKRNEQVHLLVLYAEPWQDSARVVRKRECHILCAQGNEG
jgi:hypothetical protein